MARGRPWVIFEKIHSRFKTFSVLKGSWETGKELARPAGSGIFEVNQGGNKGNALEENDIENVNGSRQSTQSAHNRRR